MGLGHPIRVLAQHFQLVVYACDAVSGERFGSNVAVQVGHASLGGASHQLFTHVKTERNILHFAGHAVFLYGFHRRLRCSKIGIPLGMLLDFDDQLRGTLGFPHHFQEGFQFGHALSVRQNQFFALRISGGLNGDAPKRRVMVHHQMAIGSDPDIGFRAIDVQFEGILKRSP